ncbi:PEP-CTERM sorting domain-containing protein [Acidiphilium sp.]|uniref:PEP-CTERM sorting domain-containing protein n=1 Tax=Acidiphilium sp. TaxID=527 RepID=UPI003D038BF0
MWVIRCAQACRGVVVSHPVAVGIPAAVTTIGTGAALGLMLASAPPLQPQLPCGCHQVWIAPVVPMTPQTYGQVMKAAGNTALAAIPLDTAPGGTIGGPGGGVNYLPPTSGTPPVVLSPLAPPTVPTPHPTPQPVPEPSTFGILALALGGLVLSRRRCRSG